MALAERGYETVRTREPGGDFVGEQVRQLLLFAASRAWVREGYLAVAVDEVFTQLWAAVQALLP